MSSPTLTMKPVSALSIPLPLPHLKVPLSTAESRLPSELPRSPCLVAVKQEDTDIKTPITPPTAYTDFLKALSPAVSTPMTATSMRSPYSFTDKTGHLTPISQPSSAGSFSQCSCDSHLKSSNKDGKHKSSSIKSTVTDSDCGQIKTTILSAPIVPPTPFVRPSPTSLRKLRIPTVPASAPATRSATTAISAATETPRSATCCHTPMSAATLSPFSPTSWSLHGKTRVFPAPHSASSRQFSVRQVVTRTVTYRATPLEPAPRGKRRRLE